MYISFIFAILFIIGLSFGQTSVSFNSNSTVYSAISESKTELEIKKIKENEIDSVGAQIELFNDSEAKRQSAMFLIDGDKTTNNEKFNIGAEFNIPIYLYKNTLRGGETGYRAAAAALGFAVKNTSEIFPFRFSAGPSFEGGENRNLQTRDTVFGGGGYFSLFGGDTSGSRIKDTPLIFGAELFGKYIKSQNDYGNVAAKAKFIYEKNGVFQTDSFSITVSDTVGYGKVNSQFGYINGLRGGEVPSRYGNNLSVLLRAAEIGDAFFQPSVEIYLNDNRYRYVSGEFFYGSLKKNTVSTLLFVNKDINSWEFETGLKLSGTREENCYFTGKDGGRQTDTLNEKLKDADVFNPQYYFSSQYLSPKETFGLSAKYAIERSRRVYPFSYRRGNETFSAIDDFDNIASVAGIQTDFYFTDWYNLYFSTEAITRQINYLKSQMSASNMIDRRFSINVGNVFSKDTTVIFSISASSVAAPQKYYFPRDDNIFPSHNRKFSIDSDLAFFYENGWSNMFKFTIGKFDKGVIYDEIYGIEEKMNEIISNVSLAKTTQFFIAAGGLDAKFQEVREFSDSEKRFSNGKRYYLFTPFTSFNFSAKDNFSLNFHAKRNINKGRRNSKDFWEVSLNAEAFF